MKKRPLSKNSVQKLLRILKLSVLLMIVSIGRVAADGAYTNSNNSNVLDAKQQKLTGTVVDAVTGEAIIGANVTIKGTTQGTVTNVNGEYVLPIPSSDVTLVVSFVGYNTEEIVLSGQSTLNIKLVAEIRQLNEVVVTALGIQKKSRGLTYSTQQIGGSELTGVKDVNMMNTLAGKSAGVVITKGGSGVGGSSKVVLRGNKSMYGNNQPLYVIDGIPMSNSSGSQPGNLYSGVDGGDAISNLNPDDIESINILKGASAAALYGSQAANGVILITTKKGKAGFSKIEVSSSTTFEQATNLPKIQNVYGQETAGVSTSSWGAASPTASNSHVKDYFNTGTNYINSISITNGNDNAQYYLSYANTSAKGIVPDNKLNKNNASFRGTSKMWKKVTLDASVDYINQKVDNRPYVGFYYNPVLATYLFPVGDDFSKYKNYEVAGGPGGSMAQNWPYINNEAGLSSQNPYWIQKRNPNTLERNRLISTFNGTYDIADWIKFQARVSYDRTTDDYEQDLYATTDQNIATTSTGDLTMLNSLSSQLYNDFLLSVNKNFGDDYSFVATVGESNVWAKSTNLRLSTITDNQGNTTYGGLFVPNVFTLANTKNLARSQSLIKTFSQAVFATAQFGYKNMLFLDVTGRNEWSSTSADPTSPYFYPSVGLSYVLTETTGVSNVLSFAKIRTSYSEVGNPLPFAGANPDQVYSFSPTGVIVFPTAKVPDGYTLEPERTKSFEVGLDARFFDNKLTFDFTYYNARSENQFFQINAPAGFGAQFENLNGGAIRNSGIEAVLGYKMVIDKFYWESSVNMSANRNEVVSLSSEIPGDYIVLNTMAQTKIYELDVPQGGSYGDFFGTAFKRDAQGNIVKDKDGAPVRDENSRTFLGNPNPKFLAGWSNTFRYKNVALKFLIDGRFGGKVVSLTEALLDSKGLSQRSADDRDKKATVIGNTSFDPKTFYTTAGGLNPITEQYVYDATNIRLREISLSYTLPKLIKGVDNLTLSLVGRNLFFITNKAPFDPDMALSSGNSLQGLDAFGVPSTRSFGVTLNASF